MATKVPPASSATGLFGVRRKLADRIGDPLLWGLAALASVFGHRIATGPDVIARAWCNMFATSS